MNSVRSPYRQLNLTRNPFGELTPQERAELAIVDVMNWLPHLQEVDAVLQLIGPCGHGKTTHMLAIGKSLPESCYVYLPEDGRQPAIPSQRPLLIDEAQRLSWWRRRTLFTLRHGINAGPLVLGTHVDYSEILVRGGFRVQTYHVATEHSPLRLQQILNRRIEASRYRPGSLPLIDLSLADELCRMFGADVRAIEHELYQRFQRSVGEKHTWPPAN